MNKYANDINSWRNIAIDLLCMISQIAACIWSIIICLTAAAGTEYSGSFLFIWIIVLLTISITGRPLAQLCHQKMFIMCEHKIFNISQCIIDILSVNRDTKIIHIHENQTICEYIFNPKIDGQFIEIDDIIINKISIKRNCLYAAITGQKRDKNIYHNIIVISLSQINLKTERK